MLTKVEEVKVGGLERICPPLRSGGQICARIGKLKLNEAELPSDRAELVTVGDLGLSC
jgi:hypothetical protein